MNFLVLAPDPVFLLDIASALRERWPDSVIAAESTAAAAREQLKKLPELAGAIIALPPAELLATDLPSLLEGKNAKIIISHSTLDGEAPEVSERGWFPLTLPFSYDSLNQAMVKAGFVSR